VFVLDYSFAVQEMLGLDAIAAKLVWIDHHARAVLRGIEAGLEMPMLISCLDLEWKASACLLTWRWLFPGKTVPPIVELASRYDTWQTVHGGPFWLLDDDAYVAQLGLWEYAAHEPPESARLTGRRWHNLLQSPHREDVSFQEVMSRGRRAVARAEAEASRLMARSFDLRWSGLTWRAINATGLSSQSFVSVFDDDIHSGMLWFAWHPRRGWIVSLRGDGVAVNRIAEEHGGGGHPNAAAFTCAELPFELPQRAPASEPAGIPGLPSQDAPAAYYVSPCSWATICRWSGQREHCEPCTWERGLWSESSFHVAGTPYSECAHCLHLLEPAGPDGRVCDYCERPDAATPSEYDYVGAGGPRRPVCDYCERPDAATPSEYDYVGAGEDCEVGDE
jgi:hypothetical protein